MYANFPCLRMLRAHFLATFALLHAFFFLSSHTCEGQHNCYVVKDVSGNNLGYSWPIEVMLGRVEDTPRGLIEDRVRAALVKGVLVEGIDLSMTKGDDPVEAL